MLIHPDSVWTNPRTGLVERVFPRDFAPVKYVQQSPTIDDLRKWATDPGLLSLIQAEGENFRPSIQGIARQVMRLDVLNGLRLVDWARAQETRVLGMANTIGLVRPEDINALAPTANAMISTLADLLATEPDTLAEKMVGQLAFNFFAAITPMISTSPILALAVSVVGFCVQQRDLLAELRFGRPAAVTSRLPLQSLEDREVSDVGRIDNSRPILVSDDRDWTQFWLPSFSGQWKIVELGKPRPEAQGWGAARGEGSGTDIHPGDGLGVMPGTCRTLDWLQFVTAFKSKRDIDDHNTGTPTASWYSHYCNANKNGCGQSPEAFTGTKDCRQCIPIDSLRRTTRGDPWEWANVVGNDAVSIGDYLPNSTQHFTALWQSFSASNPATWTIDTQAIWYAWKECWEDFFDQFIPREWGRRRGIAWRAVVANFAAWGLISREDGQIAGRGTMPDWRYEKWGSYDGIGDNVPPVPPVWSGCPADPDEICGYGEPDVLAIRRITATPFLLKWSTWEQAIRPEIERVGNVQRAGYETTMVCYLWERMGAHWDARTGKLRTNWAGKAYEENLRAVLSSPSLLRRVHMQHVVDPKIRQLLIDAGVNKAQVGAVIQAPSLGNTKPKPKPPRLVEPEGPVITALVPNWKAPPMTPPPMGGFPGTLPVPDINPGAPPPVVHETQEGSGVGLALALLGIAGAGALGLSRLHKGGRR